MCKIGDTIVLLYYKSYKDNAYRKRKQTTKKIINYEDIKIRRF